jgi:hypothetical protein
MAPRSITSFMPANIILGNHRSALSSIKILPPTFVFVVLSFVEQYLPPMLLLFFR